MDTAARRTRAEDCDEQSCLVFLWLRVFFNLFSEGNGMGGCGD